LRASAIILPDRRRGEKQHKPEAPARKAPLKDFPRWRFGLVFLAVSVGKLSSRLGQHLFELFELGKVAGLNEVFDFQAD
jgi:hypothetical protein